MRGAGPRARGVAWRTGRAARDAAVGRRRRGRSAVRGSRPGRCFAGPWIRRRGGGNDRARTGPRSPLHSGSVVVHRSVRRARRLRDRPVGDGGHPDPPRAPRRHGSLDRKSTRLNSSHITISYAVFCLKKKKKKNKKYKSIHKKNINSTT